MEDLVQSAWRYGKRFVSAGKAADYIPLLACADPNQLGICLVTSDDRWYECGDSAVRFTIQSMSKVPVLMFVLEEIGEEKLFQHVGMEPSGDAFNSGVRLEMGRDVRPFNPMINAGAIATVGLLPGHTPEQRFQRVLAYIRTICQDDGITLNEDIYRSEKETGDKNRALGYMLKANGVLVGDVEEHLDLYFRLCSLMVSCRSIARLAAVLANNGYDIHNGQRYISMHNLRVVRSLMCTCGMYDASGVFATTVGMPSKSGVGGGIFSVSPGRLGIGVFGPALDAVGNSVGGVKMLEYISGREELSIF